MTDSIVRITKRRFGSYNDHIQRIKYLKERVKQLEKELYLLSSPKTDGIPSSHNSDVALQDTIKLQKIYDIEQEINERLLEIEDIDKIINDCNGTIYPETEVRVSEVLKMHYKQNYTYEQILNRLKLDYSESGLRKRIDKEIADTTNY